MGHGFCSADRSSHARCSGTYVVSIHKQYSFPDLLQRSKLELLVLDFSLLCDNRCWVGAAQEMGGDSAFLAGHSLYLDFHLRNVKTAQFITRESCNGLHSRTVSGNTCNHVATLE